MDAHRFRTALADLGVSQLDFGRLAHVTSRAVNMWATNNRDIPGPVVAYLELLSSLPKQLIANELARLKETPMHEGMYQVTFQGAQGNGVAILVFQAGYVFGTDGGVQYDGIYTPHATDSNVIDFSLKLTVPPGVWLVQGKPAQNVTYSFDLSGSINIRGVTPLNLKTPYGPIKASVQFLRDLPADLAA